MLAFNLLYPRFSSSNSFSTSCLEDSSNWDFSASHLTADKILQKIIFFATTYLSLCKEKLRFTISFKLQLLLRHDSSKFWRLCSQASFSEWRCKLANSSLFSRFLIFCSASLRAESLSQVEIRSHLQFIKRMLSINCRRNILTEIKECNHVQTTIHFGY